MTEHAANEDVVISLRDVRKTFEDQDGNDHVVLDSVTFDIHRGETLVVMGGSGCGKGSSPAGGRTGRSSIRSSGGGI